MYVYFDTNAATYLFDRAGWSRKLLRAIRRGIGRSCRTRQICLVTSSAVLEELAGISTFDRHLYRRIVRFLLRLADRRFLLPFIEMVKREAAQHGALVGRTRYISHEDHQLLRRHIHRLHFARQIAGTVSSKIAAVKADSESRRKSVREKLGSDWSTKTRDWWKLAEPQIDDWTNDYIRGSRHLLGLPDDESRWPAPGQVPTARLRHAYYMARIALTVGEDRRIDASDYYDAEHYSNGGYFDLMVTDDQRFLETYKIIPSPHRPFRVESFRDFAANRLRLRGLPT